MVVPVETLHAPVAEAQPETTAIAAGGDDPRWRSGIGSAQTELLPRARHRLLVERDVLALVEAEEAASEVGEGEVRRVAGRPAATHAPKEDQLEAVLGTFVVEVAGVVPPLGQRIVRRHRPAGAPAAGDVV